jgi:hypothetical protein
MANVSPIYTGEEAEYFVDFLLFSERSTWNHQRHLTSEECL